MAGIVEAIRLALKGIFGEGYPIYVENSEQEFQKPCFFVTQISASSQEYLQGCRKEERVYAIRYLTQDAVAFRLECIEIGDKLLEQLETVSTDKGNLRCTQKSYEIGDGELNFSMNCNRIISRMEEKAKMTGMTIPEIQAKG